MTHLKETDQEMRALDADKAITDAQNERKPLSASMKSFATYPSLFPIHLVDSPAAKQNPSAEIRQHAYQMPI